LTATSVPHTHTIIVINTKDGGLGYTAQSWAKAYSGVPYDRITSFVYIQLNWSEQQLENLDSTTEGTISI